MVRGIFSAALLCGAISCARPEPLTLATDPLLKGNPSVPARPPDPIPEVNPEEFQYLKIGDLLAVRVHRRPELTFEIKVPGSGNIHFPLIGDIRVVDRSVEDVQSEISKRLEEFLRAPQVALDVRQYAPRLVYILGGVKGPRDYQMPSDGRLTVMQLIGLAGGLIESALREDVRLTRTVDGQIKSYSVPVARIEAGNHKDILMAPGDIVYVPYPSRTVFVLGAVKSPGGYQFPSDGRLTAARAVSLAGGFTKFASPSNAHVLRQTGGGNQSVIPVDLDRVIERGDLGADCELLPADIVVIPD
jgi:polysaccharide export outer membrane protein